jgi:lipopolysaccharide transport system permease protein
MYKLMPLSVVHETLSAFQGLLRLIRSQRRLIWEMSKREITDRYAGQVLGSCWAVGHSLILIAVYAFVFAVVFKIKLGGTQEMPLDYTVYLLSGLIPWMAFSESMAKASTVIAANAGLVKQVVFPLEVLPIKSAISSLIIQVITTGFLMAYMLISNQALPWTYALLPVAWLGQLLAMCGVGFILAALAPYFRDVKDFVQVFNVVGMYILPISYLPQWVPGMIRPALYFNPFSYMCWAYQDICYYGRFEHRFAFAKFLAGSVMLFFLGYLLFRKLKVCFGSVL